MQNLTEGQLTCLNGWPEGTAGYVEDEQLIMLVNMLCHRHGYETVCGLTTRLEAAWRKAATLDGITVEEALALEGDKEIIKLLHLLCKRHGYGRVGQLGGAIEQIWRDPILAARYWQEFHDTRMELLKGTYAYYAEEARG